MNSIFKYFTKEEDDETILRTMWFSESFPDRDFKGVNKLIFLYLKYCADLGIVAKRKYLDSFLRTDGKRLVLSHNIKLENMSAYDYGDPSALEEAYRVITASAIQFYEAAVKSEIDDTEFKVAMDVWMKKQKQEALKASLMNNMPRVAQGEGVDDVVNDLSSDLSAIAENYSEEKLEELDFLSNKRDVNEKGTGSMIKIGETHVPCIDLDIGGIFKGMIYTFTGLAGSGKSRFIYKAFAYVCAVFFHVDVRIDSPELSVRQVENMLIAMHIITLFNGKVKIPDSDMNKNNLSEEQLRYYFAAKEDLFNNKENKYGTLFISARPIYIESFRSKVMRYLRIHKDIQIWIVDYAGLVVSKPSAGSKRYGIKAEMIEDLYSIAREISINTGLTWVIINQYNREGSLKAKAGKAIDQGDIEGGQTVHKYTDYNMYTTMTDAQKQTNITIMTADKVRGAKGFNQVPFKQDLPISLFTQQAKTILS